MENETIADIVREIREYTTAAGEFWRDMEDALELAERIEAAAKLEIDHLRAALDARNAAAASAIIFRSLTISP